MCGKQEQMIGRVVVEHVIIDFFMHLAHLITN